MTNQHFPALLFVSVILTSPALDAEPRQQTPNPVLTILLDNYAGVDTETLMTAAEIARAVYSSAGVETLWIDCGTRSGDTVSESVCEVLPRPDSIRVRIMPTVRAGFDGVGRLVYGFALLSTSGGFGWAATVFQDRVAAKAQASDLPEAELLGCVMAHEAGHLLLGRNGHSSYGLMSGDWSRAELQKIGEGALVFVGGEKKKIQRGAKARLAAAASAE